MGYQYLLHNDRFWINANVTREKSNYLFGFPDQIKKGHAVFLNGQPEVIRQINGATAYFSGTALLLEASGALATTAVIVGTGLNWM